MSLLERCERLLSCVVGLMGGERASPTLIRPRGLVLSDVDFVAAVDDDGADGGTSSLAAEFRRRASRTLDEGLGLRGM